SQPPSGPRRRGPPASRSSTASPPSSKSRTGPSTNPSCNARSRHGRSGRPSALPRPRSGSSPESGRSARSSGPRPASPGQPHPGPEARNRQASPNPPRFGRNPKAALLKPKPGNNMPAEIRRLLRTRPAGTRQQTPLREKDARTVAHRVARVRTHVLLDVANGTTTRNVVVPAAAKRMPNRLRAHPIDLDDANAIPRPTQHRTQRLNPVLRTDRAGRETAAKFVPD